jgi:hypothetical protein
LSPLKIRPITAEEVRAINGAKVGARAQNRNARETIDTEHQIITTLVDDVDTRVAYAAAKGIAIDRLTVWNDFTPELHPYTNINISHLPEWSNISEYMKAQLGFYATLVFKGYAFTATLNPKLEAKWVMQGKDISKLIRQRVRMELNAAGLNDLPFFYVIEGKTKRRSKTKLHLHGFAIPENPSGATTIELLLEKALQAGPLYRPEKNSHFDVEVKLAYDKRDGHWGAGRWVSYLMKNALKPEPRITGRRTHFSTSFTDVAHEFWKLIREEPIA